MGQTLLFIYACSASYILCDCHVYGLFYYYPARICQIELAYILSTAHCLFLYCIQEYVYLRRKEYPQSSMIKSHNTLADHAR